MSQRPNVVFITWHDAGRWFGCYGQPHVRTPHVDALAAQGVRFTQCFSACAICSPSRAAIMTGRRCQAVGVMGLTNTVVDNRIFPREVHLARRLRHEHGYHTALFGVQHECAHEHVTEVIDPHERFNTDPWPIATRSADAFEQWIDRRSWADQPFYAQIGTYEGHLHAFYSGRPPAHYPQVADDTDGVAQPFYIEPDDRAHATVANLQGLLHHGDAMIGRVADALHRAGLADNTLIVMCVDHGVGLPRAKATCYDTGTGVAWVLRWPRVIPAGAECHALAAHVDVLPTVLELLDLPLPDNLHGHSFADHARGRRADERNRFVFSHMVDSARSIRSRTHKLIRNFTPPNPGVGFARTGLTIHRACTAAVDQPSHLELYDLAADPRETTNLAHDPAHRALRDDLDRRLWAYLFEHRDFITEEVARTDWQVETRRQRSAFLAG